MAGKQVAPEVKGEFSKGNAPLQDLQELSTEVIVDLTEYPEVQRNDQDTVKATPFLLLSKTKAGRVDIPAGFFHSLIRTGFSTTCSIMTLWREKFWNRNRNCATAAATSPSRAFQESAR